MGGFLNTVCIDPLSVKTDSSRHPMLALFLFAFSKIPELGDTAFLILKGKPVRFLQWYHHSTVMLFCWLAIATEDTPGIWFAMTNYTVHAVMYMYFFLTAFSSLKRFVKVVAPLVTVIMYSSYFVLFSQLFLESRRAKASGKRAKLLGSGDEQQQQNMVKGAVLKPNGTWRRRAVSAGLL